MQSNQQPIIHAPEDIGFTHTTFDQFTYFSGSEAGVRETYGMPVLQIGKLIIDFSESFMRENKSDDSTINAIFKKISDLVTQLKACLSELRLKKRYSNAGEIANGIRACGHIPIILSKGTAAEQYGQAARMVSEYDIRGYFEAMPGAEDQAREFLVKQDIMKMLAEFRNGLFQERYKIANTAPAFFTLNKLIQGIDKIILSNQQSMPKNCEQFDIFEAFRKKTFAIASEFDRTITDEELLKRIEALFWKVSEGNVYEAQKTLSDGLYDILINYVTMVIGIKKEGGDSYLNDKQVAMLQDILPLVAYLNSSQNPFSRLGLFGKEITGNEFHTRALVAYKLHESKVHVMNSSYKFLTKKEGQPSGSERKDGDPKTKPVKVIYDADQIDQLLYGPPEDQQKEMGVESGFMSRIGNTIMGLLTENSAGSQSTKSKSEQRQKLLALPVPTQYLLLEPPKQDPKQAVKR